MDTRDSRRSPLSNSAREFLFSFLNYFSRLNKGIAATEIIFYKMRSLWTLAGRSLSRLSQRFWWRDCRLAGAACLWIKVDEWEECLGEGSAGFQDCSGKDCLKVKRFFLLRNRREGGRRRVFSPRMTKIKQTIFQHVYLERDEDNIYVSHSLSRRVALLLDGSIFL